MSWLRAYWRWLNRGKIQIDKRVVWGIIAIVAVLFVVRMISRG